MSRGCRDSTVGRVPALRRARAAVIAGLAAAGLLAGLAVSAATADAPTATTGDATIVPGTGLTQTHVQVTGTVYSKATASYRFVYGTDENRLTSSTNSQTHIGSSKPETVSRPIGFKPATTYYYELEVVYNGGASIALGGVRSITTPAG